MPKHFIFLLFFFVSQFSFAARIKGRVLDSAGKPLGYASVVVKGTALGTMTNDLGEYALELPQMGDYTIVYQFVGYESVLKKVSVEDKEVIVNVNLRGQAISLKELKVSKAKEDYAYSIMRKAIAKSKIHDKQVDFFDANIYAKNTFTITEAPGILRKQLEKDGMKLGVVTVTETVSNLQFTQPNKRVVKVLGKKNSFDNVDLDGFFLLNFYQSDSPLNIVSPLSPKAFAYYKFEYLGFFEEHGQVINKIQIIPRSYGPGVFKGTIFIVEDLWNIHSVDVETVYQGLSIKMQQLFAPSPVVWVPINQVVHFGGKVLGIGMKGKVQVNPKYNKLVINERYVPEVKVLEAGTKVSSKADQTLPQEFNLKQMKKMIKEAEKEEKKLAKAENIVKEDSLFIDSLSQKRDLSFWEEMRSIPLTPEEKKGYQLGDSIRVVKAETRKDTSNPKQADKGLFKQILLGNRYYLNPPKEERTFIDYKSPFIPFKAINYNIVEGIFTEAQINYGRSSLNDKYDKWLFDWKNTIKYTFGPKEFQGVSTLELRKLQHQFNLGLERKSQSYDNHQDIPAYVNTLLNVFKINLTPMYMQKGLNLGYKFAQDKQWVVKSNLAYYQRNSMEVLEKLPFEIGNRTPTQNFPTNIELGDTHFQTHNAVLWESSVAYQAGHKYRLRNNKKIYIGSDAPLFTLGYKKGMHDVNYDFVSLSVKHAIKSGPQENFKYYAEVGSFLNNQKMYLMDMRHINSVNVFEGLSGGYYSFYRILNTDLPLQISPDNYYRYSTKGEYVKVHMINNFRKLLVTQMPLARFVGLKEDVFVNFLSTQAQKKYVELGYGLNGIFKLLRVEVITAWDESGNNRWGWQLGVAF